MYLDSCILVKLVSHEPDSAAWEAQVCGHPVVTSELAVTEVRSALLAKERLGHLTPRDRTFGWRLFQEKIAGGEFVLLPLHRAVVERAGGLIEQCHPRVALRALDALHVATAELQGGETMCSSDRRVCDACDLIGLPLVPAPGPMPPSPHA